MIEKLLKALDGRAFQTAVIETENIIFSEDAINACAANVCRQYNACWSCPPASGGLAVHKQRINSYSKALIFTTKWQLEDPYDYPGMMDAKLGHDKITQAVHDAFGKVSPVYGAGSCSLCEQCAYPQPCRFPERIFPSIEGAGIMVSELSRHSGINYINGENTVTYFSLVLLDKKEV